MKKIYLLMIIIILLPLCLKAQNVLNPPPIPELIGSSEIDTTSPGFVLGWNWSSPGAKLDSALSINFYHCHQNDRDLNDTIYHYPIRQAVVLGHNIINLQRYGNLFSGEAIYMKPTITVDSTSAFKPKAGDTTGAIFGFRHRNFSVGDTTSDNNVFMLHKSGVAGDSVVVLDSIWENNCLRYLDYIKGQSEGGNTNHDTINSTTDSIVYRPFNGKRFFLTINVLVKNISEISAHLNDTIFTIELPYILAHKSGDTTTYSSGFVKFENLPDTSSSAVKDTLNRGLYREIDTIPPPTKPIIFAITGKMLSVPDTMKSIDNSGYITLSALMTFEGRQVGNQFINNPRLQYDNPGNPQGITDWITQMDCRVYYHGKADLIGISYVKIETPKFSDIAWGRHDDEVREAVKDLLTFDSGKVQQPHIYRFYSMDEAPINLWHPMHYFSKLVNDMALSEAGSDMSNQYMHATASKEVWTGTGIFYNPGDGNPFIRRGINPGCSVNPPYPTLSMYYGYGYCGNDCQVNYDSLSSDYETHLIEFHGSSTTLPITNPDFHNNQDPLHHYYLNSIQMRLEDVLYNYLYKRTDLIYSDERWFSDVWLTCTGWQYFETPDVTSIDPTGVRGHTGEEANESIFTDLLVGSKGLIYYTKTSVPTGLDTAAHARGTTGNEYKKIIGMQASSDTSFQNTLPYDDSLINSDVLGGDFIPFGSDPNFPHAFNFSAYDWNLMGVDSSRFYIGFKSMRSAIYKIHKFIKANETTLLNLRLMSWFGHGYISMYSQNPSLTTEHYMDNFIDVSGIRTRKTYDINRTLVTYNTLNPKLTWEGRKEYNFQDSSFFDVTLHKNVAEDTTMKNIWYVALVNRRTDPLVIMSDGGSGHSVNFYSSAEWDHNMDFGGPTYIPGNPTLTAAQWQSLLWRRLGAREILLPFSYVNPSDTTEYCLLHVTEMMDSSAYKASWPYWRKEHWNRRVDTIIGQNSQLAMKFQPGEGKFLKVEVLHPDKITGDLAYSNQNKLVAWSATNPNPPYNTGMRYHITYQRLDAGTGLSHVYYRRSQFITKDDPLTEAVKWEPERRLDSLVTYLKSDGRTDTLLNRSYFYPSIVLRDSGVSTYAHVVFQGEFSKNAASTDSIPFTCSPRVFKAGGNCLKNPIVETIIRVSDLVPTIIQERALYNYKFSIVPANYGQPVICAAKQGNFIAWSDSLCGIRVIYKLPMATSYKTITTIRAGFNMLYDTAKAQHPSISPFSPDYNQCSIVWQDGNAGSFQTPGIMFTNLKYDSTTNSISKFLAPNIKFSRFLRDSTNNLVLSTGVRDQNSFPVIVNYLDYVGIYKDGLVKPFKDQRIFWQNVSMGAQYQSSIYGVLLQNQYSDANHEIPSITTVSNPTAVKVVSPIGIQKNLYYPHAALGPSFVADTFGVKQMSRESYNLVYNYDNKIIGNYGDPVDPLGGVTSSGKSTFDNPKLQSYSESIISSVKNGNSPHLSISKDLGIYTTLWKNRIVYGSGSSIITNADGFYKTTPYEVICEYMLRYTGNLIHRYFISVPSIDDRTITMHLPFDETTDTLGNTITVPNYSDTVYSDWFNVASSAELKYKLMIDDTVFIDMKIQKQSDMSYINLPKWLSPATDYGLLIYYLLNGMGENYRIMMINKDTVTGQFERRAYLDGLPNLDTINAKTSNPNLSYVYLNGDANHSLRRNDIFLSVYPNPTQDQVFVKADLPAEIFINTPNSRVSNSVSYKIYNSLGAEMGTYSGNSGETIEIPTANYGGGVYFIRAEIESNYFNRYDAIPATQTIVIER